MIFLLGWPNFRGYVTFRECIIFVSIHPCHGSLRMFVANASKASFAIENPVSRGMLYGWSELDTVHEMTMTMASFLFEFDAIPTWCHTSKCCSAG